MQDSRKEVLLPTDHGTGRVEDEERHPGVGDVVGRDLVPGGHHRAVLVVVKELHESVRHELRSHEAANVLLHLVELLLSAAGQDGGLGHAGAETHDLDSGLGEVKLTNSQPSESYQPFHFMVITSLPMHLVNVTTELLLTLYW